MRCRSKGVNGAAYAAVVPDHTALLDTWTATDSDGSRHVLTIRHRTGFALDSHDVNYRCLRAPGTPSRHPDVARSGMSQDEAYSLADEIRREVPVEWIQG